jgi:hypothetical protein
MSAEIKGVQFVTDTHGNKVVVQLDLSEWGELWEDIYDSLLVKERAAEPSAPWESVTERLRREGKLSAHGSWS